jgi:NitT/TauT family transport system substrate-binding protein
MDALIVSPSREGVAVLPTSTSKGADACLVTEKIADLEALKQYKVYGLKGTVSEYCFVRCLEKAGMNEADYQFTNQDPAAAAQNMTSSAETHQAIMVWNPFVLQAQRDRSDVRVLFDSSQIPGEIVDMVVVGKDVMEKDGADKFVAAVAEAFYEVATAIDGTKRGDEILEALGKKFSRLGLEDMREVVQQTVFYSTPTEAKALLNGDEFKKNMQTVIKFCTSHDGLVNEADVSVGYGADAGEVKLRFDASLLQ